MNYTSSTMLFSKVKFIKSGFSYKFKLIITNFLFQKFKDKYLSHKSVSVDNFEVHITPVAPYLLNQMPPKGILVKHFPFRIGRLPLPNEKTVVPNQLNICDIQPFQLSRSHLVIDIEKDNILVLHDTSRFGTIVNGAKIGGLLKQKKAYLRLGENEVIVGEQNSDFVFNIIVSTDNTG